MDKLFNTVIIWHTLLGNTHYRNCTDIYIVAELERNHMPKKNGNLSIREILVITLPYVRPSAPQGNQCEMPNFLASVGPYNLCLSWW